MTTHIKSKVLDKIKQGAGKLGQFLDKQFIDPSRRVKRHNSKMDALNKEKAKSGKLNTGEAYAESQTI